MSLGCVSLLSSGLERLSDKTLHLSLKQPFLLWNRRPSQHLRRTLAASVPMNEDTHSTRQTLKMAPLQWVCRREERQTDIHTDRQTDRQADWADLSKKANELNFRKESCVHAQSCPTLCNPMVCSPPSSSGHGISQARILESAAISYSRGSSQPSASPASAGRWIHYHCTAWEAPQKRIATHRHPKTPDACGTS